MLFGWADRKFGHPSPYEMKSSKKATSGKRQMWWQRQVLIAIIHFLRKVGPDVRNRTNHLLWRYTKRPILPKAFRPTTCRRFSEKKQPLPSTTLIQCFFFMCCWPCILAMINFWFQVNAHQFYFINYASLHVSGTHVPIFRRINYTFTTTGSMSFSLGDHTVGRLVKDAVLH